MKRIKIRSDICKDGKVLRFDESIDFGALIQKIAHKLGHDVVTATNTSTTSTSISIQDQWELRLGGNLLEETDEIDSGDAILLVRKNSKQSNNTHGNVDPATIPVPPDAVVKRSEQDNTTNHHNNDHDDDATYLDTSADVEDTTEQVLEERRKNKRVPEVVDLMSSSSEEEDEHDDDDEGSIEEGSDAWDESSSSEQDNKKDDSDSDFDDAEEEKAKKATSSAKSCAKTNTRKAVNIKPPPEPPLRVDMEEKDMPAAPGNKPSAAAKKGDDPTTMDDEDGRGLPLEEVSILVDVDAGAAKAEQTESIKHRIIKLLNTGFHDQSNEHEAKNAMKLAQRLMQKHNLSQALLLNERKTKNDTDQNGHGIHGGDNDEILKGGIVKVRIVNRRTGKPAVYARWINDLAAGPIANNFKVKSYHVVARARQCTVAFYGIYTNAQLAAHAFRVAAERISQMAAAYNVAVKQKQTTHKKHKQKQQPPRSRCISTKSSRLSYAIGIVEGISKDVDLNIQAEEERRWRKLDRARRAVSKGGEAYDDVDEDVASDQEQDDDDDQGSNNADLNTHLNGFDDNDDDDNQDQGTGVAFADPAASKNDCTVDTDDGHDDNNAEFILGTPINATSHDSVRNANDCHNDDLDDANVNVNVRRQQQQRRTLQEFENEQQAAIVLVDHREKIAEQILEQQGIKLKTGRKRSNVMTFDRESYHRGVEDARDIDINQRAIRDEVKTSSSSIHIKKEEKKRKKR
jgi:hypothetical protein